MIRRLLLACLAIAAMPTAANAEVLVGGVIDTAATWTAANSPYRVTSEVRVVGGATLRIEAGVTVDSTRGQLSWLNSVRWKPLVAMRARSS